MAIASLEFGVPSPAPSAPSSGKKLYLGADGKLKTVSSDGTVSNVGVTDWDEVQNKPSEFPPSLHTSEKISDFVSAVNGSITVIDAGTY